MRIELHSHTLLSDGELIPIELARRAVVKGHQALAITDHASLSNLDRLLTEAKRDIPLAKEWGLELLVGVEITHVPAKKLDLVVKEAKKRGAQVIVVHGETVSEPVDPGTNRAAVNNPDVDILAHPGFITLEEVETAKKNAAATGGKFEVVGSMEAAFQGADIVYPKSWAPYEVMGRRTELLKKSDKDGLKGLEKECLANNAKFKSWECDRAKMDLTAGKKALYMHCLPADITDVSCKEGEVSAEVFEQYRIPTYQEAAYKPFIISALMFLERIENPGAKLASIVERAKKLSL